MSLGWSFFKLPDFSQAQIFLTQAFTGWTGGIEQKKEFLIVGIYCIPVALYHLNSRLRLTERFAVLTPVAYGVMLYAIAFNGAAADAFIYFQF